MNAQLTTQFSPLTVEEVSALFDRKGDWCASIYIPTAEAGKEIRQSPIRLKNRLSEAEQQLEEAGSDQAPVAKACELLKQRCDLDSDENRAFWRHQGRGLAVLLDGTDEHFFRLPQPVDRSAVVAQRFHLKPLLRAVNRDEEYCVLAVSQQQVRFLDGSRSGLSERPVEQLPESLQAVIRGDHIKGFNMHSFNVRPGDGDAAVPHGHLDSNEQHELRRYFGTIDQALHEELRGDTRPLIFAGVGELFPFFRDTTEYGFLEETPIAGNPDELSATELHDKAWPMIAKRFKQRQQDALQRYQSAVHNDLGESDLEKILIAAHDGRIDTLLVQSGATCWGTYDADSRSLQRDDESSAENYDLIDLATVKTFAAQGSVVFLDDASLPDGQVAAAICRYPME